MFAKEYSWSIEYIMDLTRRQMNSLLKANENLRKMADGKQASQSSNLPDGKKSSLTNKLQLLTMPGSRMTERAKKAFLKSKGISQFLDKEKKEKTDA